MQAASTPDQQVRGALERGGVQLGRLHPARDRPERTATVASSIGSRADALMPVIAELIV